MAPNKQPLLQARATEQSACAEGATGRSGVLGKVGDVSRAVRDGDGTIGNAGHWVDEQDLKTLRAKPLGHGRAHRRCYGVLVPEDHP